MAEESERKWSHSVLSDSLQPRGLWPTRLLHPWNFPDKSTGVGCHFILQGFNPWVRMIPWRRKWQPTPVLSSGKFHGWRSLVGYNPRGCKESDKTEWLHFLSLSSAIPVYKYLRICTAYRISPRRLGFVEWAQHPFWSSTSLSFQIYPHSLSTSQSSCSRHSVPFQIVPGLCSYSLCLEELSLLMYLRKT